MKRIPNVPSMLNSLLILNTEGFSVVRIVKDKDSYLTYFLNDQNQDVGYWLKDLNLLHINDLPRAWSPEFLATVEDVPFTPESP